MSELLFDEELHQYTVEGRIIPSVTQIISAVGLYEFDFVSDETLAVAAERGRKVHQMIEYYEQDDLDETTIDPELKGYFTSYLSMKLSIGMPKPDRIEQRAWSEKYGYAGTLDQMFGDSWINDHKTGLPSPVHGLQLSAYWLMLHPDMREKPYKLTCDYLFRDGAEGELVEYPYEPLVWLSILADYKWRLKNNLIRSRWR
jgi:hypothetical protein